MNRANADKFIVRLPDGMRDEIAIAAEASGRSMNAEIVYRLRAYRQDDTQAKLDQILALLSPAPPASTIESHEGTPEYFMELEKRIAANQVSTMRMPDPRGAGHMPLQIAPRVPKSRKR